MGSDLLSLGCSDLSAFRVDGLQGDLMYAGGVLFVPMLSVGAGLLRFPLSTHENTTASLLPKQQVC